jgi:hypothetical protein
VVVREVIVDKLDVGRPLSLRQCEALVANLIEIIHVIDACNELDAAVTA